MLSDRGVTVDHVTAFRWVQAYAATLKQRAGPHLWPCTYLNNVMEQDRRRIKRLVQLDPGSGSLRTAGRTLAVYEARAIIRKGQVYTIDGHVIQAQTAFVNGLFQTAA
jgi:IS6 family transposase